MAASDDRVMFEGSRGQLRAAVSVPGRAVGAVLLIHENRGLTPHFVELTSRLAAHGYTTMCVDLASAGEGTDALGSDEAVREHLANAPRAELLDDIRSGFTELAGHAPGHRLGVVGFCFGGTMTWALLDAGEPRIAAAVAFYGTTPDPSNFSDSSAAVLGIYAGLDERVNASRDRAEQALVEAGLTHRVVTFDGVDHAFFNDTGPRFDEAAAASAWQLTLDWLAAHVGSSAP